MKRKVIMGIIIVLLCVACALINNVNRINLNKNKVEAQKSVIANYQTTISSIDDNSLFEINNNFNELKHKFKVLSYVSSDDKISDLANEINSLESYLSEDNILSDKEVFDKVNDKILQITEDTNMILIKAGIELENSQFKTITITIDDIDTSKKVFLGKNEYNNFEINVRNIKDLDSFNQNDVITVYFNSITYKDSTGLCTPYFIEKK